MYFYQSSGKQLQFHTEFLRNMKEGGRIDFGWGTLDPCPPPPDPLVGSVPGFAGSFLVKASFVVGGNPDFGVEGRTTC